MINFIRMNPLNRALHVLAFLLFSYALQAQVTYSNEFLNIGVGARALGMSLRTCGEISFCGAGHGDYRDHIQQEYGL